MRRRSRSLIPPQMPNFSLFTRAYSRHWARHDAAPAHLLRLAGGCTPLGEEQVGVDAEAVGVVLPRAVVGICGHGEFHLAPFPVVSPSDVVGHGAGLHGIRGIHPQFHSCNYIDGILPRTVAPGARGARVNSRLPSSRSCGATSPRLDVDAIVNAANASLLGGRRGRRRHPPGRRPRAAGRVPDARRLRRRATPRRRGGYRLPARWVIHTVGPVWQGGGARRARAAGVVLPPRSLEVADELGADVGRVPRHLHRRLRLPAGPGGGDVAVDTRALDPEPASPGSLLVAFDAETASSTPSAWMSAVRDKLIAVRPSGPRAPGASASRHAA